MSSARPTKVPLAKPLTTNQLHREQIKEALKGANDEQKQDLFQKKKNHIDSYHRILNKVKPSKKPFNQKSNVPLVPKKEDLEQLQDETIDFDQAMKEYIESELMFDDDNNTTTFFLDDADPDYKRAATGNDEIEEDPDYEYDQEPIEEEIYSAKPLSKPQAIKAFTGVDDKLLGKQFKFITTGYYKAAIAEASRQSSIKHIQLEKSEVIETIKQLKSYDKSITEPGEGLLFAEQDPSLTFFITVYLKNPYLHNISSPVDVPLLKPILNFSKEQLPFSSLQMLLIVQDDQYEQYTNILKESEYIGKLKVMKLSEVMLEIGTTYLNGNTFENTRYNRFNEKKHFLNQYDLLFCDTTLSKKVSALFNSYKKRKQGFRPVTSTNVVDWVKNDLTHSKAFITQGNSHFTIRIARTEWEEKDIYANISHFLENKSNNAENKEAFSQLAQSDIRMVMLHTNRSIYVKVYENVDIDLQKAKVFKAEKRWKNKDAPVEPVKEAPSTPKKGAKSTESTPKKAEQTPKKTETPKKSAPTPKKTETKEVVVEQPTTPKKNETKEEAKSAKKQQTPKKVEEKQEAQPVTPKKTPKKAEPTPKKVESTPKKSEVVEKVVEPVQETPKKSQTPKKAATPSATPKRSVGDLKAKLGSVQKKK